MLIFCRYSWIAFIKMFLSLNVNSYKKNIKEKSVKILTMVSD